MLSKRSVLALACGAMFIVSACSKKDDAAVVKNEPNPGASAPAPSVTNSESENLKITSNEVDSGKKEDAPTDVPAVENTDASKKTVLEGIWEGVCEPTRYVDLAKIVEFLGFSVDNLTESQRQILRVIGDKLTQTVTYFFGKGCQAEEKPAGQSEAGLEVAKEFKVEVQDSSETAPGATDVKLTDHSGNEIPNLFSFENGELQFGDVSKMFDALNGQVENVEELRPTEVNEALPFEKKE